MTINKLKATQHAVVLQAHAYIQLHLHHAGCHTCYFNNYKVIFRALILCGFGKTKGLMLCASVYMYVAYNDWKVISNLIML